MLNNTKSIFRIQDLEILSGIKAHTIRIWEKRYRLLSPSRINRNVREYDIQELQKILNISLLQNGKYKISQLAKLSDEEIHQLVKNTSSEEINSNAYLNSLIISMFSLDEYLFEEVYEKQSRVLSFEEIFVGTYIPLLRHMGMLWQTQSLTPKHEHFISNLIFQKIALNIALLPKVKKENNLAYVLFLPQGEVHEISLYYFSYHLKLHGQKVLYLGSDMPVDNLDEINALFDRIIWVSSFTIDKTLEDKSKFINSIENLIQNTSNSCWVVGNIWDTFPRTSVSNRINFLSSFKDAIDKGLK